jgi:phosphohistidine phosphatase
LATDLYLVRHAIAYERDALRWPDDAERPLTKEGVQKFERGAAGLASLVKPVDVVLSSGFVRAWQTAGLLHEVASWPAALRFAALEPGTSASEIIARLRDYAEHHAIALVGHEPTLSYLAGALLAGTDADLDLVMKKGGAAALRFIGPVEAGMGQLQWWATPKMLRSLAR